MIRIKRSELARLYKENYNHVVAKKLGISKAGLIYLIKKYGIPLKGKSSGRKVEVILD